MRGKEVGGDSCQKPDAAGLKIDSIDDLLWIDYEFWIIFTYHVYINVYLFILYTLYEIKFDHNKNDFVLYYTGQFYF